MPETKDKTGREKLLEDIAAAQKLPIDCRDVPINLIDVVREHDTREEDEFHYSLFVQSIKDLKTFIHPILVLEKKDGRFELVCGHRRFKAAKEAGLTHVPVRISDWPQKAIELVRYAENLGRRRPTKKEIEDDTERMMSLYIDMYGLDEDHFRLGNIKGTQEEEAKRGAGGRYRGAEPGDPPAKPRRPPAAAHLAGGQGTSLPTAYRRVEAFINKTKDPIDDKDEPALSDDPNPARGNLQEIQLTPDEERNKVFEKVLPASPGHSYEESLPDNDWLEQFATGDAREDIEKKAPYDRQALLYRQVWPHIMALKEQIGEITQSVCSDGYGPLSATLDQLFRLNHPILWKTCPVCKGKGRDTGNKECLKCHGNGFTMSFAPPPPVRKPIKR